MLPLPGRPWVIAHRGASAAFPENTLAAFRGAAALGADAVELDARRTADGLVVVHHDAVIPGAGAIVEHTAASLRRRAPWVPSLAEALEACAGMWVDVEVKNSPADPDWDPADGLVPRVLEVIGEAGRAGTVLITSFNPAAMARAGALQPGLPTGWLVENAPLLPAVARAAEQGHRFLLPHHSLLAGEAAGAAVEAARRGGIGLIAWTVDDPAEGRRLAAAGLDGIVTNRPDVIRSALDEHRHHHGG
jgi:glycerophosphoryl diester phosphodiesterase